MQITSIEELQSARQQYEMLCRNKTDYARAEVLLKAIQQAERDHRHWRR